MQKIINQTEENLAIKGINRVAFLNRSEFIKVIFIFKHPVTKKEETYSFNLFEFNKMEIEEKMKYKKLKRVEEFDEKGYLKAKEKNIKLANKYEKLFEEEYKKNQNKMKISDIQLKTFKHMKEVLQDYDLNIDCYSDSDKILLEFEEEIMEVIKLIK